ncbi:MAG: aminotransferase class I/II-fold pyridoxal phosphate-dependent enzyme [Buchananella hordeovulneris]|nr:aminotransferase class I/II-fold pyridoxal phosphate-dependent enzyme [Buchananella hordeovulneris]
MGDMDDVAAQPSSSSACASPAGPDVRPYGFDAVDPVERAATGSRKWSREPSTIGAWVAEMDFRSPAPVLEAAAGLVLSSNLGYPTPARTADAVSATADFLRDSFGWEVSPEHISLSGDVLSVLMEVISRLTRPGSAVVVPTPAYMPFLSLPAAEGRPVIQVPSEPDEDGLYRLDLAGIEAALQAGAGLVVLCNPWNPVGRVLSQAELEDLRDVVSKYDALVFSDEIHSPLVHSCPSAANRHVPYGSLPGTAAHTVTALAATKAFNIPALRCAQVVVTDPGLAKRFAVSKRLLSATYSPIGAAASAAGFREARKWLQALNHYIAGNVAAFRREMAKTDLLRTFPVEGTYLAWVDASELAKYLPADKCVQHVVVKEALVDVNDGQSCGDAFGHYFRVNLATSRSLVVEIAQRIVRAAQAYGPGGS